MHRTLMLLCHTLHINSYKYRFNTNLKFPQYLETEGEAREWKIVWQKTKRCSTNLNPMTNHYNVLSKTWSVYCRYFQNDKLCFPKYKITIGDFMLHHILKSDALIIILILDSYSGGFHCVFKNDNFVYKLPISFLSLLSIFLGSIYNRIKSPVKSTDSKTQLSGQCVNHKFYMHVHVHRISKLTL